MALPQSSSCDATTCALDGRRYAPQAALARYGTDLVELARRGLLDPVIGRQDVMQRTLQVLLR